jgi:hypothetical protein
MLSVKGFNILFIILSYLPVQKVVVLMRSIRAELGHRLRVVATVAYCWLFVIQHVGAEMNLRSCVVLNILGVQDDTRVWLLKVLVEDNKVLGLQGPLA